MENLRKAVGSLKDKFTKTELERQLGEATNNDNWGTPATLLQQISERTFSSGGDRQVIMKHAWETLRAPGKEWRRVYKALGLIEHLLKFGAPQCVQEIRDEAFKFRQLIEFNFLEDGTERGNGIRDKAKYISHLIADFQQLEVEREAARKMAGRYVGISANDYMNGGVRGPPASSYNPSPSSGYNPSYNPSSSYNPSASQSNPYSDAEQSKYSSSFQPPAYSEPNLFAPPPQTKPAPSLFEMPARPQAPVAAEPVRSQPKPVTNLFEVPKPSATPSPPNLFEVSKPAAPPAAQPAAPSATDLLFTMPPKPAAAPIFTMPAAKPAPQVFAMPQASPKEQKTAAIFTLPTQKQGTTPLLEAKPQATAPKVEAGALDGLFTAPAQPTPSAATSYPKYAPQGAGPPTMVKVHHNMEGISGPTISQLKTTPSITATLAPKNTQQAAKAPVDIESFLVDLDNLRVESKEKTEQTHLHGFGASI